MKFTEKRLEQAIIELLANECIPHVHGIETSRSPEEVLLKADLHEFLTRQYKDDGITDGEINVVIRQLESYAASDLYESNKAVMKMVSDGFLLKREDRNQKDLYVQLIDYSEANNNDYKIVNQLEIRGYETRVPDGMLYINGLPLVVFEFKSAIREEATIHDAYIQLTARYQRDIPELFKYNALCVISDGVNNKIGSLFAPYEYFYAWRKITGDEAINKEGIDSLYTLIHGLFNQDRLREVIRHFIYFPDTSKTDEKFVCRYPQYYAATKLYKNIKHHRQPEGDGKGGTYFGATGCGKSITMLYLTRLLMKSVDFASPTIILITDRTDLDDQLAAQFTNAKGYIGDETVISISSREELRELLQGRKSGGVFLTTIHKFNEDTQLLTDRNNVICISDEAHRSQVNMEQKVRITKDGVKRSYGFAKHLHDSLPNATYVGFTGTPIDATLDVFGELVDSYTMTESVKDEITVRLVYEGRAAKVLLDSIELKKVEEYYAKCAEDGVSDYAIEESKKATTKMQAILGDPDRIKMLAADFVGHYEKRVSEGSTLKGKAMFVSSSRKIAYEFYKQVRALRPEWAEVKSYEVGAELSDQEKKKIKPMPRIKLVATRHKDDEKELWYLLGTKGYRKELDRQFKNANSNLKIAVVVDMWLTGFDVPFLDTIYIDKPIQRHNLIQAISRVNRKFESKKKGLVVDYIGIKKQMNLALAHYNKADQQNIEEIDQSVVVVKDHLDLLAKLLHGFDATPYFDGSPLEQLDCLNLAAEFVQLTQELERRFMYLVKRLKAAYDISSGTDAFSQYERDLIHFYLAVRSIVFKFTKGDAPDTAQMNAKVGEMIKNALQADGVAEVFKMGEKQGGQLDIFDDDYLAKIEKIKLPNTKIKLLQRLLTQAIADFKKVNKVQGIEFSKKMQALVERYNERDEQSVLVSNVLEDFSNEVVDLIHALKKEQASFLDMGIDFEEKAFYDILKSLAIKYDFIYPEDELIALAKDVKMVVDDKAKYTDWNKRDDIKAELKVDLIILLGNHGYPPVDRDEVYQEIFEQAENFKKNRLNQKLSFHYPGYLFFDTDDFEKAQSAFDAFKNFVESLGMEVINEGVFLHGSWIRKGIQILHKAFNSRESKNTLDKAQKAVELAAIERSQSEVNKNNAEAAAAYLNAVKDIPEAAARIGSLMIIKLVIDGKTQVITNVLTTEQLLLIERYPDLLNKPALLLQQLNENNNNPLH